MKTVIAIDGPAASGKSTVARRVAADLGYGWVNSGGFYRALTWWLLRCAGSACTPEEAAAVVARTTFTSVFRGFEATLSLDGNDAWPHLREPEVNSHVSPFSQFDSVRDRLNGEFRRLAGERPCVVEGRDIGSCVFPETPYKFFIDASPEIRRLRRQAEDHSDEIATRDRLDSGRARAPLVAAPGALVIDTSHLSIEEVLGRIREALPPEVLAPPR
ncbi:MAG: (d)CMP kinase [Terrimicrobiaceae bacterium]